MTTRRDFLAAASTISLTPMGADVTRISFVEHEESVDPPPTNYITTPEKHGWNAGLTPPDQTKAVMAAIEDARSHGKPDARAAVEFNGEYVLTCPNGKDHHYPVGCIVVDGEANLELRPAPDTFPVIKFASWAGQSGMHNRSLLLLDDAQNVVARDLELDGNKMSIGGTAGLSKINYSKGDNGGIHCIQVLGGRGIKIEQVHAFDALTDGMKIHVARPTKDTRIPTTNFQCTNSTFHHCRRNGVSTIECGLADGGFDQLVFESGLCEFAGDDDRGLPGEAPGANWGTEPDGSGNNQYGVTIKNWVFGHSQGATWALGKPRSRPTAGRGAYWDLREGQVTRYWKLDNVVSVGNRGEGLIFNTRGGSVEDFQIDGLEMEGNGDDTLIFQDHKRTGKGGLRRVSIKNVWRGVLFNGTTLPLPMSGNDVTIDRLTVPTVDRQGVDTIRWG